MDVIKVQRVLPGGDVLITIEYSSSQDALRGFLNSIATYQLITSSKTKPCVWHNEPNILFLYPYGREHLSDVSTPSMIHSDATMLRRCNCTRLFKSLQHQFHD